MAVSFQSGPQGSTGTVGNTAFQAIDPSSLPGGGTYSKILSDLQSRLPGAPPSYQDILTQGINSPLLQTVLNPAMQNLRSQFDLQNQQFNDEFRSAGALGSGAQAVGMGRLAQAQGNSQGNLIAQIISQMMGQFSQGLNQQYQNQLAVPGLLGSILGSAKPQIVTGGMGGGGVIGGGGGGGHTPSQADKIYAQDPLGSISPNEYDPTGGLDLSGFGGGGGYSPPTDYSGWGASYYSPTQYPDYQGDPGFESPSYPDYSDYSDGGFADEF